MRLHRFIGDFDLGARRLAVRDAALANQLANVLRLDAGDEVMLCDGRGKEASATIVSLGKAEMEFDLSPATDCTTEPERRVTLCCAVLKRENFELVVQKAVEAGVAAIVPVLTHRTVKQGLRGDRLVKIAKEAAEQSGRGIVPPIGEPIALAKAFDLAHGKSAGFFDFGGTDAAPALAAAGPEVFLFIGPEGGWDEAESAEARKRGLGILSLGPRTLRAETAAIVATWLAALPAR
jgi:16S rRNA (uracil1498-N3)-methyltransferase